MISSKTLKEENVMKIVLEIEFIPMDEDYDDTEEWVFTEEEFLKNISKFTHIQQTAFLNYVTESNFSYDEIDANTIINVFRKNYNFVPRLFTDCLMNFDVVEDTFYRI